MSQYPPPADLNYAYGAYRPSPRPTSVSVLSIIAIVLGALGLLCGGLGLLGQIMILMTGGKNPFAPTAPVMTNSALAVYGAVSALVSLILSAALLAGGIGGLKLSPRARRLMILWSIVVIVWATLNLIVQLVWINPATAEITRQTQAKLNPQAAQTMSQFMGPLQIVAAFIGWLLWCILPVLFLTLWRSPKVVQAFEGAPPGQAYPQPGLPPQPPVA